jgi:uncharacterized protein YllA (UPF0747 family)
MIENEPYNFSPNVLLRPICQDYILPTGFYVGGPAEISYFAQVIPNYDLFDLVQPIIYPRASATLIEKNIANIVQKYDLSYTDLFLDEQILNSKVLSKLSDNTVNDLFNNLTDSLEKGIELIKNQLLQIDKNLEDPIEKTKQNLSSSIDKLKGRTQKAQEGMHDVAMRQLNKAKLYVYPNSNLQERELNIIFYFNKYNLDIIHRIFNDLAINKFEHQIIEI